jgi:15-cis-phytoene synthase
MRDLIKRGAQQIMKQFGTGYYRATFLFPKKIREDTWTLYKFVRIPDEIVDDRGSDASKKEALSEWIENWNALYTGQATLGDGILFEMKELMIRYDIDKTYVDEFLAVMMQDITVDRYETYEELKKYMYGSACVIGIMMSHVIGYEEEALPYAEALGEAMQLTNFLRDIREDYEGRGRIYVPLEDLKRFGVIEEHIKDHVCDDNWRELMKFQVVRARALFSYANSGIKYLHPHGRAAIWAASYIYEAILDEIEKQDYDIFVRRAVVSPFRKTMLLWKAIWKRKK